MTTAVATQPVQTSAPPAKKQTVKDLFLSPTVQQSLRDVLPKHLTPDRMAKVALVEIAKNPTLTRCTPTSLLKCLMQAGELGLDFGGVLGQAYMVPYKAEATFIVGYRGLITLARRSGEIESIAAYCVYKGEKFRVTAGLEGSIEHEIDYAVARDPKNIVAAYAVAKLKGGSRHFEVMSRSEIDSIRGRSRAGANGPWVSDFGEMAKKTVVRRLAKYLPLSPEDPFAKAMGVDGDRLAEEAGPSATDSLNEMLGSDAGGDTPEISPTPPQQQPASGEADAGQAAAADAATAEDGAGDAAGDDADLPPADPLVTLLAEQGNCTADEAFAAIDRHCSRIRNKPLEELNARERKDVERLIRAGDIKI